MGKQVTKNVMVRMAIVIGLMLVMFNLVKFLV